ncbi:hypothetical protein [Kibdelosporangium philippinense]|uniref:hypothetical protein n=1 Tax=Kibdelosporangium philippinense TaxID=211113 RepID=UPI00360B61C9
MIYFRIAKGNDVGDPDTGLPFSHGGFVPLAASEDFVSAGARNGVILLLFMGMDKAHHAPRVRPSGGATWLGPRKTGQLTLLDGASPPVSSICRESALGEAERPAREHRTWSAPWWFGRSYRSNHSRRP